MVIFLFVIGVGLLVSCGNAEVERKEKPAGQLVGAGGHTATGLVVLHDKVLTLSLHHIDRVPDGRVYLANDSLKIESGFELGPLTQFSGTVHYPIPETVDMEDYSHLLIWCKKFSVEIGHARLVTGQE